MSADHFELLGIDAHDFPYESCKYFENKSVLRLVAAKYIYL